MKRKARRFLILDANILIDFCQSDKTIIKLICDYVGQVYLATPILAEINDINENDCIELGIILIEPDLEEIMLAAGKKGPLSFQDNLCLLIAKRLGWTCVTNDQPLRRMCEIEGVPLFWGIELICILVESGGLLAGQAGGIILEIQKNNPMYITDNIVKSAFKRLKLK